MTYVFFVALLLQFLVLFSTMLKSTIHTVIYSLSSLFSAHCTIIIIAPVQHSQQADTLGNISWLCRPLNSAVKVHRIVTLQVVRRAEF